MVQNVQSSEREVLKLPSMSQEEVDRLLSTQRICRMALNDSPQPYIIPLDYVYMDCKLYFHFAKYGKKIDLINRDPHVSVEVDQYNNDVSKYCSVTLMGTLAKVTDPGERQRASEALISSISSRGGERNVAARHGYHALDKRALLSDESLLLRLDVRDCVALKSPGI